MKLSKPKYIFCYGRRCVVARQGYYFGLDSPAAAGARLFGDHSETRPHQRRSRNAESLRTRRMLVTEDGAGDRPRSGPLHERFTNQPTSKANNVTTGRIYKSVIEKERKGEYLGKTVQVIPHITDEIKRRIQLLAQKKVYDVIITEIGGTVGDIESLPFIESVRQLRYSLGYKNTALVPDADPLHGGFWAS